MTDDCVILTTDGPVATITLNRPAQYNAMDKALRAALQAAVAKVEADPRLHIAILRGAGRGFSAGGDLTDFNYDPISTLIEGEFMPILQAIHWGTKLYVAQIHGQAAGIGAALALCCDFVAMADDAQLYLAFAAIALVPDGGLTWHLLQALGRHRTLAAIVEGQRLDAATCRDAGLANKVFAPDALEAGVAAWAQTLATRAPLAARAAKRLLRQVAPLDWAAATRAEAQEQNALIRTQDFRRGAEAFFHRQSPQFMGD